MGVRMWIISGAMCLSFLWHSVQLGFGCVSGRKMFFLWLPIYWAYLNFSVWVICASLTLSFIQKWLESFWFICSFESHLSTYGNLCFAISVFRDSCSFVMNVFRLHMAPSCVDVGQPANQYGVEFAICMWGVEDGFSLRVPSLASVSAISFPMMHVCARTLCMCTLCGVQYICRMMAAMSNLARW